MSVGPPTPAPDDLTGFFWEGCRAGRLLIQRCSSCGTYIHFPRLICSNCLGTALAPAEVSGHGRLYSWTVAMQAFHPWFADQVPYLIASIALDEQDDLRMISSLVDYDEQDLRIDMPVRVVFRDVGDDLVLPFFTPVERVNRRVAVVGAGYSTIGRKTGLTSRELTIQCVKAALDDAGLRAADVDGYTTVGGEPLSDAQMLGMQPLSYFSEAMMAPAFSYAAHAAITAVAVGQCETAIATRIIRQQPTGQALVDQNATSRAMGVGGDAQFVAPFGAGSPTQWAGLMTQRRMGEYGETEDQYAAHVVTQRQHAALNDDAIFRDPLTAEDYLASRYVSKPVHILDCDYPVDSGSAVIFTTRERARDLRQKPVFVDAWALSSVRELNFELLPDMVRTAPHHCGQLLWSRTELTPGDVDVAGLYDGFSFITFNWLEALGLCPEGEAGPFIAEGNTKLGGTIPTNTDGGACNVGRRHGANFCIETMRQLRGQCGERQVPGAEVAVWTNAVGPFAAAFLMTA